MRYRSSVYPERRRRVSLFFCFIVLTFFSSFVNYSYAADSWNVEEVGYWRTPSEAWAVVINGSYAYVADRYFGLRIINITNPKAPYEVGYCDTPGEAKFLAISGFYAYIGDDSTGLRIININNPVSPYEVGHFSTPAIVYGVAVNQNYAYLAETDNIIRIININSPSNPYEVGHCNVPAPALNVAVNSSFVYVADSLWGLRIIDVSTPSNPYEIGGCDSSLRYSCGVAIKEPYAYVADRLWGLHIINISTASHPFEVGHYNNPGDGYRVFINGNYAYLGDGNSGLRIINVNNPTSPYEVGFYDTPGFAIGVDVKNGFIYVADGNEGLRILRFTSTGTITGQIRDHNSNLPIPNSLVIAESTTLSHFSTFSNNSGYYSISVPVGIYTVTASKQWYKSAWTENVSVAKDSSITCSFSLDTFPGTEFQWGTVMYRGHFITDPSWSLNSAIAKMNSLGVKQARFWFNWDTVETTLLPFDATYINTHFDELVQQYADGNIPSANFYANWTVYDKIIEGLNSNTTIPFPVIADGSYTPYIIANGIRYRISPDPRGKVFNLAYNPEFGNYYGIGSTEYLARLKLFVAAAARRYSSGKKSVFFWNTENELNWAWIHGLFGSRQGQIWGDRFMLSSAGKQVGFPGVVLETMQSAVKTGNPTALTSMNFNLNSIDEFRTFFQRFLTDVTVPLNASWISDLINWKDYVDIVGIGVYYNHLFANPVLGYTLNQDLKLVKSCVGSNKPIMVTESGTFSAFPIIIYEYGIPVNIGWTNATQKEFMSQVVASSYFGGAKGFGWYQLRDWLPVGHSINPLSEFFASTDSSAGIVDTKWGNKQNFAYYKSYINNPQLLKDTYDRINQWGALYPLYSSVNLLSNIVSTTAITFQNKVSQAIFSFSWNWSPLSLQGVTGTATLSLYQPDSTLYGTWNISSSTFDQEVLSPDTGNWFVTMTVSAATSESIPVVIVVTTPDTHIPLVDAGPDSTILLTNGYSTTIQLDGTIASGNNNKVYYHWKYGDSILSSDTADTLSGGVIVSITTTLRPGYHTFTLTGDDGSNPLVTDSVTIRIFNGNELPDVKLIKKQSGSNLFDLDDYYGSDTSVKKWIASCGFTKVTVDSVNHKISYPIPSMSSTGIDTVLFYADSTLQYQPMLKYSSYLLKRLPDALVDNGWKVSNYDINLQSYISKDTSIGYPSSYPYSISYGNSSDTGKLNVTFSGSTIRISPNRALLAPAKIIVTATPDTSSNDYDKEIIHVYEILNSYGQFSVSSDTSNWYYQVYADGTGTGTLSRVTSYAGQSGVLKLTQTMGQKAKLSQIFTVPAPGWYTARAKVATDIADTTKQQKVYLYLQEFSENSVITACANQVIAPGAGGFSGAGIWKNMMISFYTQSTILAVQVVGINSYSGITGSIYIGGIWVYAAPPQVERCYGATKVAIANSSFETSTSGWLVETYADGSGPGTWSWTDTQFGRDGMVCGTQSGGEKGKLSQLFNFPSATKNASASVWVYSGATSQSNTQKVYLYLYSYDSSYHQVMESGNGILYAGQWNPGEWREIRFGYTPMSNYNAVQFVGINPLGKPTATIYFDDVAVIQDQDSIYYWDHTLY